MTTATLPATADHALDLQTLEGQLNLIKVRLENGISLASDTARLLDLAHAVLGLDPTEPRWAGRTGKYARGYNDALQVVRERAEDAVVPC